MELYDNLGDMTTDSIISQLENDPSLRVSIKGIFLQVINGRLCVLLGLHSKHRRLILPGGGVEPSEIRLWGIEDTLCRELKEEIGLNIWRVYRRYEPLVEQTLPPNRALVTTWSKEGKPRIDVGLVFHLPAGYHLPFNPKNLPSGSELGAVEWVPIDELSRSDCFDNTREMLRDLIPHLRGGLPQGGVDGDGFDFGIENQGLDRFTFES